MFIQPPYVYAQMESRQELVLQRKDVAACPLGSVGNLQFKPERGGTARANRYKTQLTWALHALSDRAFLLTHTSSQAQTQRRDLIQARENSRLIGNLLGNLTAPAHDPEGQARIAEGLIELATRCEGRFDDLKGGQQVLDWYVTELSDVDFQALANGVLRNNFAKQAVLNQISDSDPLLGARASQVLDRIERSMRGQLNEIRGDSRFTQFLRWLLRPFQNEGQ